MKRSRITYSQVFLIRENAQAGVPVAELCREHGMSNATFYNWRSKYGGMDASAMKRLKELEEGNARLKKMYAEEKLKAEIVSETLEKNCSVICLRQDGETSSNRVWRIDRARLPGLPHLRNLFPVHPEAEQ